MQIVLILLVAAAAIVMASVLALHAYGRFAMRSRGDLSTAMALSDDATAYDRLVAPLLAGRPGLSGLVLVAENVDAFAVRARSARQAERSLDIQYYIWDDDLTGCLLAHEILAAADRGVRVRILVDDINARGRDRAYLALDAHPEIEVRLFNPSLSRRNAIASGLELLVSALRINRRMHNKAWIADGRIAVVGGRNLGDAYFDAAESSNFRDLDLMAIGPAVAQAERIFDRFWNSRCVIPIVALGKRRRRDLPRLRGRLAEIAASPRARPYLAGLAGSDTVRRMLEGEAEIHWSEGVRVVSDPPGKIELSDGDDWLKSVIRPLLDSATAAIEITSPYFIPGVTGSRLLIDAVGRGVDVAVLTNSLAATDVAAVHGAYARYRRRLIEGGVRLYELKPFPDDRGGISMFGSSQASLHTKAFTVDGRCGYVGSMNFDPRSVALNTEMGILFEDPRLVARLKEVFAAELERSYAVGIEAGAIRWRSGGRTVPGYEPGAGFWRRVFSALIGYLPIESQL